MKIQEVRAFTAHTAFKGSFRTTYGTIDAQPHVFVKMVSDSGQVGWGEASPLPFFTGELAETIETSINNCLGPAITDYDPFDLEAIHQIMDLKLARATSAKSAIDMAAHDLIAKTLGIPLAKLIGGQLGDSLEVAYAIGEGPIEIMAQEALEKINEGFTTLKIKIGIDPEKDVQVVKRIREAVGGAVNLRLDANQGYDPKTAVHVIRQLEPCNLQYVEQPVPTWNHEGLAFVRDHVEVPIMADESLHSLDSARRLAEKKAVDLFAIKFIKTGGIYPAKKIAHLAEAFGIGIVFISTFDTHIGQSAGVHFALSLKNRVYAQEALGTLYHEKQITRGAEVIKGRISALSVPGLGAEPLNPECLA
ncbi:MAG: mandelate racemase/muconate lactonizing enzyme family protein [Bacillota bacterium]